MRVKRKCCIILLVWVMAFNGINGFSASEENDPSFYNQNVELLKALGVLDETYAVMNKPESSLSMGIVRNIAEKFKYTDAYDSDSEIITLGTSIKIMIEALGYQPRAFTTKMEDMDFYRLASSIGLLDGIQSDYSSVLTSETFVQMLINAIEIPIMEISSIGNEDIMFQANQTFLERNNIFRVDGIVDANCFTSLNYAEGTDPGYFSLNHTQYLDNESGIGEYLGYHVRCYLMQSDEDTNARLVYFVPLSKNKLLTVSSDMIHPATTAQKFAYEQENKSGMVYPS